MAAGTHVTGVDLTNSDGNVDITFNTGDNTFTFTATVSPSDVQAAGSDRQIQFNDGAALGATSQLEYTANGTLSVDSKLGQTDPVFEVGDSSGNGVFNSKFEVPSPDSAPTLSATSNESTDYTYAFAARTEDGRRTLRSPSATITGPNSLDSSNTVTVDWNAISGAFDYVVLKEISGTFRVLGTTTNTQFTDEGQNTSQYNFPTENETLSTENLGYFNVGRNRTADTSGDLQIRDDSTGDLFSLDDGNTPALSARYLGSEAFTLGYRTGSVGAASYVLGGSTSSTTFNSEPSENEASGVRSVAIGYGNQSLKEEAISIGTENVNDHIVSAFIGTNNESTGSITGGQVSYVLGFNNTLGESNGQVVIGTDNEVGSGDDSTFDDATVLVGDGLNYGVTNNPSTPGYIFGEFNEELTFDTGFVVGVGASGSRRNAIVVENGANPPTTSVNALNIGTTDSTAVVGGKGFSGISNAILSEGSSGAGSPSSSIVWESTVNDGAANSSIVFNASFTNASNISFFDSVALQSTFDGFNANVDQGGLYVNTDLTSSNIDDFRSQNDSSTNVSVFSYNNKTIVGYAGGLTRDGSVIIAGNGSGGFIGDAGNSVSISGASVTTSDTVGIGANTFIETSDTGALNVRSSSKDVFNVDTSNEIVSIEGYDFEQDNSTNTLTLTSPTDSTIIQALESGPVSFPSGLDLSFPLELAADSISSFVNAGVTTNPSAGDLVGYRFDIDSEPVVQLEAEADGSGSIQSKCFTVKGSFDSSAGEYTTVFKIDETGTVVEGSIDTSTVNITAAGDDGDFLLNQSGNVDALTGTTEANFDSSNESFTFGQRNGTEGTGSVLLGGISGNNNTATGTNALVAGVGSSASGNASVALGDNVTAAGDSSVALGNNAGVLGTGGFAANSAIVQALNAHAINSATASGEESHAEGGAFTEAQGLQSHAGGNQSTAATDFTRVHGFDVVSRTAASIAFGLYNEDYLGSGNEKKSLAFFDRPGNERIFQLGVGDNPGLDFGSSFYYDGRGDTDAFYVTYRNGTFARDALTGIDTEDDTFFDARLEVRSIYDQPRLTTNGSVGSGTTIAYAVVARDADANRTRLSPKNTIDADDSQIDSSNTVDITWNDKPNASDYVVLKDVGDTGDFDELAVVAAGSSGLTTTFTDSGQSTSAFAEPTQNETALFSFGGGSFEVNASGEVVSGSVGSIDAPGDDGDFLLNQSGDIGALTASGKEAFYDSSKEAFTFGDRSGTVGFDSFVLGEGEASGSRSLAFGGILTVASGNTAVALGDAVESSGGSATAFGDGTVASGDFSTAMGKDTTASGTGSVAMNSLTTANASQATAMGRRTTASAIASTAMGQDVLSQIRTGTALGVYNEDFSGSGAIFISGHGTSDRIFAVGVGDDPSASSGDNAFFDGRERTDAFYVTYRNGAFVRDGMALLDNEDNEFFDSSLRVRSIYTAPTLTENGSTGSGTNYDYAVAARDADGNRTLLSPIATLLDADRSQFNTSGDNVTIDWDGRPGATDYVVVVDVGQTGSFEEVGTTTNTTFDDTGQTLSAFTAPTQNETAAVTLGINNTADTSGDIQIRDDSSGDIFSLDSGPDAKYEGDSAFTFGFRDGVVGAGSFVINGDFIGNEAAGRNSFAAGDNTVAGASEAVAFGRSTEASAGSSIAAGGSTITHTGAEFSFAIGGVAETYGRDSAAIGSHVLTRTLAEVSVGVYNEDYTATNTSGAIRDVSADDRKFRVGIGDDPNEGEGGPAYFDGRGRADGLYVTYRNGTFVRDGIQAIDNEDNQFFDSGLEVRSIYAQPTLTETGNTGTGTNYDYAVAARDSDGDRTLLSPTVTLTDADRSVLDGSNFITISWDGRAAATDYAVVVDEGQTGNFELVGTTTNTSFDDTGQTLSAFSEPTQNETARFLFEGDATIDKNETQAFLVRDSGGVGDVFSVDTTTGDARVEQPGQGVILTAPDGTEYRVRVENDGTIVSSQV